MPVANLSQIWGLDVGRAGLSHCPCNPAVTLLPFLCHQIIENCPVTGIQVRADDFGVKRVYAVETAHGTIQTPCVVNCAGTGHEARRGRWGAAGWGVALHPVSRRVCIGPCPHVPPIWLPPPDHRRSAEEGEVLSAGLLSPCRRVGASPGPAGRRARAAGGDASRLRGDRAHRGHSGQSGWLQIGCSALEGGAGACPPICGRVRWDRPPWLPRT